MLKRRVPHQSVGLVLQKAKAVSRTLTGTRQVGAGQRHTPYAAKAANMGKSGGNAIAEALKTYDSLGAVECCLVHRNGGISGTLEGSFDSSTCYMVPNRLLPGNRAYLDGNLVRRKLPIGLREYVIRDNELAGFGLRVRPTGKRYWYVRARRRGKHRRVSLTRSNCQPQ